MVPFQTAYPMIIFLIFLILAGNTAFVSIVTRLVLIVSHDLFVANFVSEAISVFSNTTDILAWCPVKPTLYNVCSHFRLSIPSSDVLLQMDYFQDSTSSLTHIRDYPVSPGPS